MPRTYIKPPLFIPRSCDKDHDMSNNCSKDRHRNRYENSPPIISREYGHHHQGAPIEAFGRKKGGVMLKQRSTQEYF